MFIQDNKLPSDVLIKQIWWNKYAKIRNSAGISTFFYSYILGYPGIHSSPMTASFNN